MKKIKGSSLVHPITGEAKFCFPSGDFIFCNFTVKDGKVYRYSKTKDFLKFFRKWRKRKSNSEDLIQQKEKEPASKQSSNS